MKQDYPHISIATLCGLFGKTRHAYYDQLWRKKECLIKEDFVLLKVLEIRKNLPRVGTRKLHHMLKPLLAEHQIKLGRDYLFNLLQDHKLLIRRRKRQVITTNSRHWMFKYSNLIKDLVVNRPEQIWVSDITYIKLFNKWCYLSLITDAYSHKIMGYGFRTDLSAKGCIDALEMAIDNRLYSHNLIHHSDRGSQYCSKAYVNILLDNTIAISMTQNGSPYENAIAERINGIIKSEFNLYSCNTSFYKLKTKIEKAIENYNYLRPHASCDYLTPNQAHKKQGQLKKRWKNYNKKKNNPKKTVQSF